MIVSASYKTDIPAFYGAWFRNRLDAGYCKVLNPYSNRAQRVSLARDDVSAFVFWTKNVGPFLGTLAEVRRRGYPFVVQYSITGYPRPLEPHVVPAAASVRHMRMLCDLYGPRSAVWRYDTIVFSSVTPPRFHLRTFERLCRELEKTTDEVVVSFAQVYRKTAANMNAAASKLAFSWEDPDDGTKRQLCTSLQQMAIARGIRLSVCSQARLVVKGAQAARCVDAMRLSDVAGYYMSAKLKGNRRDCGCYASRDVGEYDTCPHGCVYCYAVTNHDQAQKRFREHDPSGEFLSGPRGIVEEQVGSKPRPGARQPRLF